MAARHFLTESNKYSASANGISGKRVSVHHMGEFVTLIRRLQAAGAKVTNGDEFLALVDHDPQPPRDPDFFTVDAATAHRAVTDRVTFGAAVETARGAWDSYLSKARRAILETMEGEVDEYLDALRPAFDAAAAPVLHALKLGLSAHTSSDFLANDASGEQVTAWRAACKAEKALDQIADLRVALSAWLLVPPITNAWDGSMPTDFTAAFVKGGDPEQHDATDLSPEQVHHRWLDLGSGLHLNSIADLKATGAASSAAGDTAWVKHHTANPVHA